MASTRNLFISSIIAAAAFTETNAVLPPDSIPEMQQDAAEVLLVSVDKVNPLPSPRCINYVEVDAAIVNVNRTTLGLSAGQDVSFESFSYDRESPGCKGMVGPVSPQELAQGWCGYVYLDASKIDPATPNVHLSLAAYSGSLVGQPKDQCEKEAPPLVDTPPTTKSTKATLAPLGSDPCTWAPDYECWPGAGWHSCCFSDDIRCPSQPACEKEQHLGANLLGAPTSTSLKSASETEQLLGSDYCTYAPEYSCYQEGWPSCCLDSTTECPTQKPQCDKHQLLGSDYCTHAPEYSCYQEGWPSCCSDSSTECPTQKPQCDKGKLLGANYCTHAPEYSCYQEGWPSCCSDSSTECPTQKPQCDKGADLPGSSTSAKLKSAFETKQLLGSDYCTHAPEYSCYQEGWPSCCSDSTIECPTQKPQCDKQQLLGSDYCTHAPEYSCYQEGWPSCCSDSTTECPTKKPGCDVLPPGGRMLRGSSNNRT